jgi:hypothetical protein
MATDISEVVPLKKGEGDEMKRVACRLEEAANMCRRPAI